MADARRRSGHQDPREKGLVKNVERAVSDMLPQLKRIEVLLREQKAELDALRTQVSDLTARVCDLEHPPGCTCQGCF